MAPRDIREIYRSSRAAYDAGDLAKARALVIQVVRRRPNEPALWVHLGNLEAEMELLQAAMRSYRKAIRIDPTFLRAYVGSGLALLEANRPRDAREMFLRALAIREDAPARIHLGVTRTRLGELNDARTDFLVATELAPTNVDAWMGLAMSYLPEDADRARPCLERAQALDPADVRPRRELAILQWLAGERKEGEQKLARLRQEHPSDSMTWVYSAIVVHAAGDAREAIEFLSKASDAAPVWAWPCTLAARMALGFGSLGMARTLTRMALDLDPNDQSAQRLLCELERDA